MSARSLIRQITSVAALAALGLGIYWSLRLARADFLFRADSESAVRGALRLAPGNAEYHARLAAILDGAGEPGAEAELRRAVDLNPRLASAWIELGLRAENAGDLTRADEDLLRAARADRTYTPLWTLANFYFRHERREQFWPVVRRALAIGDVRAYDPAPLFALCRKFTTDPDTVLERAIPDVGAVDSRYLQFLVRENLAPAAEHVTERVVALSGDGDLGAVFEYCDRLIAAGDAERAIHAWNALCWRTLHGYRRIDPQAGVSLTNADFSVEPVGHGFDWRLPEFDGVTVERGGLTPRLWITFDGREPETCDVATQVVALVPGRKYKLRFRYQTDGLAAESGVRWRLTDVGKRAEFPTDARDLSSEMETAGVVHFTASTETRLARLVLAYRRTPGTVRIDGRLSLSDLALEFDR